jgi:hypothetical protein
VGIPANRRPGAERCPALDQRGGPQTATIELCVGRNDRDPVTHASQCDERVRRRALEKHFQSDMSALASGVEPLPRQELSAEQQQPLLR